MTRRRGCCPRRLPLCRLPAFDRAPDIAADALYVVGGLYGNSAALDAVEATGGSRAGDVADRLQRRLPLVRCGAGVVRRDRCGASRAIAPSARQCRDRDRAPAATSARLRLRLSGLGRRRRGAALERDPDRASPDGGNSRPRVGTAGPLCRCTSWRRSAELRVGIVHGDATALAGWALRARRARRSGRSRPRLATVRRTAGVDVFASTHTCLAVLRDFRAARRAADGDQQRRRRHAEFLRLRASGWSRASARPPAPHQPLYGLVRDGVHVDALALAYDHAAFLARFLARWPEGFGGARVVFPAHHGRSRSHDRAGTPAVRRARTVTDIPP